MNGCGRAHLQRRRDELRVGRERRRPRRRTPGCRWHRWRGPRRPPRRRSPSTARPWSRRGRCSTTLGTSSTPVRIDSETSMPCLSQVSSPATCSLIVIDGVARRRSRAGSPGSTDRELENGCSAAILIGAPSLTPVFVVVAVMRDVLGRQDAVVGDASRAAMPDSPGSRIAVVIARDAVVGEADAADRRACRPSVPLSTTPALVAEAWLGDTAHEPTPRPANAAAIRIMSSVSSALAAARIASRCSVKVAFGRRQQQAGHDVVGHPAARDGHAVLVGQHVEHFPHHASPRPHRCCGPRCWRRPGGPASRSAAGSRRRCGGS